jgi:hypothetical protein
MRGTLDSTLPWWIAGPVLALAVAAGVLAGVRLQPRLARAAEQAAKRAESPIPAVQGADVL